MHDSIGALNGVSVKVDSENISVTNNDSPSSPGVVELLCHEVLEPETPKEQKISNIERQRDLQWAQAAQIWIETYVGRWRCAFSHFMGWLDANDSIISTVSDLIKENDTLKNKFRSLLEPIQIHHGLAETIKDTIMDKMTRCDYSSDAELNVQLEHCIKFAMSQEPWGLLPSVDRLAAFCNEILNLHDITVTGSNTSGQQ